MQEFKERIVNAIEVCQGKGIKLQQFIQHYGVKYNKSDADNKYYPESVSNCACILGCVLLAENVPLESEQWPSDVLAKQLNINLSQLYNIVSGFDGKDVSIASYEDFFNLGVELKNSFLNSSTENNTASPSVGPKE